MLNKIFRPPYVRTALHVQRMRSSCKFSSLVPTTITQSLGTRLVSLDDWLDTSYLYLLGPGSVLHALDLLQLYSLLSGCPRSSVKGRRRGAAKCERVWPGGGGHKGRQRGRRKSATIG